MDVISLQRGFLGSACSVAGRIEEHKHTHTEAAGRRPWLSLELESRLLGALGTEPRSSVRAVSSPNH